MRILVVSDTHGDDTNLEYVLWKEGRFDVFCHCGDIEGREDYIRSLVDCTSYMVSGNNDFFSDLEREEQFSLGRYRVMMTHGHQYGISMGPSILADEAAARGMDIAMCGHSHKPMIEQVGSVTVLNPGSLSYPRQAGRKPSYIIMEIAKNGAASFSIRYLDR